MHCTECRAHPACNAEVQLREDKGGIIPDFQTHWQHYAHVGQCSSFVHTDIS